MKENDAPVELCFEVLRRLDEAGVLKDMVLIGSWCGYFYRDYFNDAEYGSVLRTRDMDFLIATPPKFTKEVDVTRLLKDLGFLPDIIGEGLVRLSHPDLLIDFLVPEKGRGSDLALACPAARGAPATLLNARPRIGLKRLPAIGAALPYYLHGRALPCLKVAEPPSQVEEARPAAETGHDGRRSGPAKIYRRFLDTFQTALRRDSSDPEGDGRAPIELGDRGRATILRAP